jgi:hypothetical protein
MLCSEGKQSSSQINFISRVKKEQSKIQKQQHSFWVWTLCQQSFVKASSKFISWAKLSIQRNSNMGLPSPFFHLRGEKKKINKKLFVQEKRWGSKPSHLGISAKRRITLAPTTLHLDSTRHLAPESKTEPLYLQTKKRKALPASRHAM